VIVGVQRVGGAVGVGALGDDPGPGCGEGGQRGQEHRRPVPVLQQADVVAEQQEGVVAGGRTGVLVDGVENRVPQPALAGDLDGAGRRVEAGHRDAAALQFQRCAPGPAPDIQHVPATEPQRAMVVRLPIARPGQIVLGRRAVDQPVVPLDDLDDRPWHPPTGQRPWADPAEHRVRVADHLAEDVADGRWVHGHYS
jgi:hypothetical protein